MQGAMGRGKTINPILIRATQSSHPCNISLSPQIAQKPPWNHVKPCRCQGAHCGCGVYASEAGLCRLTVYQAPTMQALPVVLLSRDMFDYVSNKKRDISMLFRIGSLKEEFLGTQTHHARGNLPEVFSSQTVVLVLLKLLGF